MLTTGDRLGPYEIVEQIGAGGMGVVYRARDARVGRDVAIKVSAEEFGERFEREARAVAALNHPNVCTLHDIGPNYLVMELVEGEALKGPLPLATAFNYARQIADALDAAHEKGIVHRDLKPANIRIRHDGTVKVLDFGLAKVTAPAAAGVTDRNLSDSPTLALAATEAGMILGTAPYMAPEQARGKPVDKRADIWAFGVVLYEMVTGRRAFQGEDVSSVLAAVIQSEPRWDGVPEHARRVIESCLEKDPRKRLRDIGDVGRLLDDASTSSSAASSRSWTASIGWLAAAVVSLAAVALWAPWRGLPVPTPPPTMRLDVDLGADVLLFPLTSPTFSSIAISPDGTRLAYVGSLVGGRPRLFTRRLDQSQGTALSGTEGAMDPFFSPEGQWVAFHNRRQVAKIPVDGGPVELLADLSVITGGAWSNDGDLVVASGGPLGKGLFRISPTRKDPVPILNLAPGETFHNTPNVLPGGKSALIAVVGTPPSPENIRIDVVSLADGVRKTLAQGTSPRYLSSGHLIYTKRATMFAVPFDLDRLETRGTPVAVLDDVAHDYLTTAGQFDVSRTGTLVYRKHIPTSSIATVEWIDPAGKHEPILSKPGSYAGIPRISPDSKHLAFAMREGSRQDIWVYDLQTEQMRPVSTGVESFGGPVWSPDNKYVVFGSIGGPGMYWTRADGSGPPQLLTSSKQGHVPMSFAPDGTLAYVQIESTPQIWTVAVEETSAGLKAGKSEPFLITKFTDADAMFSPDGKWIAYTSNESGNSEVYVRAFPPKSPTDGRRRLISTNGATLPVWSSNRRDLLYRSGDRIMAVGYTASGDEFVPEKPRAWGESIGSAGAFDLAPDGRRILALVPTATAGPAKPEHSVVFILNFFDELRRRVPVDR